MAISMIKLLILAFNFFTYAHGGRIHEQIYSSIEGGAPCFRRLNGTHQAGCSSSNNGAVGVVHMVNDLMDAHWMVLNSSAGPYMAVVSTVQFNSVMELFLAIPDNVAGVLLYENAFNSATSFSQETRCPNEYYSDPESTCSSSLSGGIVWNEKGTGLLRRNIPFPIFFLPASKYDEIEKINKCYQQYNIDKANQNGRPLCSLQLNSFMFAAVNSEVCIRRSASSALFTASKVCDPLGDSNVYYSLFPQTKDSNKKITLVTARIDSASLFDGVSPGAASSVVGMVTLMAAATTLSKMIPIEDSKLYDGNVLWTLFNGESFDYIGSQRVAYDIKKGTWPPSAPLTPKDIKLHVELGQIGGSLTRGDSWPFHAYVPVSDGTKPEISEFMNIMQSNVQPYNMLISTEYTNNLPPSSIHSFRRILTNTSDFGELVITDHNETFTNMFYLSALDEYDKINFAYKNITVDNNGKFYSTDFLLANGTMKASDPQVKIARFATALARTLYQGIAGKPFTADVTASAHLVDEMLYCFLQNQACRLITAADYSNPGTEEKPAAKPAPTYVGVSSWAVPTPVFAGHLLALLTGTHLPDGHTACNAKTAPGYSYYWLQGWNNSGVCIETTMNTSAAVSPAFVISGYDLKSGVYSSWTESVWASMWARVFVSAGGGGARAAACAGAVSTALAALLTYWLHKHAHQVFEIPAAFIVNDEAAAGILRTVNC